MGAAVNRAPGSLIVQQVSSEANGGIGPYVGASHSAILLWPVRRPVKSLPAELEAFVHITLAQRIILRAEHSVVTFEVRRCFIVQLRYDEQ